MKKCSDCATPDECAAVGYDCGHEPVYGDAVFTRVDNAVTGRDDFLVDRADEYILIANDIVLQAFNQPNDTLYGQIGVDLAHDLFIVINGRNRQVRYQLTGQRLNQPNDLVWEAEIVGDSYHAC